MRPVVAQIMVGHRALPDVVRLRTGAADLVVPAAIEMPVAFELGTGGTGGDFHLDVRPLCLSVPIHVIGSDPVRDALIA